MKNWLGALLFCLAAVTGCAVNPVTGERDFALVSEAEEIQQGRRYHELIVQRYGIYDDPALQAYVDRVGQQLARSSHRAHLQFHFTVLDTPEINAFALPGGYIYITRGIMAYLESEAELAGVLGHEIGHVTAKHSVRQQGGQFASDLLGVLIATATGSGTLANASQAIGTGIIRGYGREHELEADRLGAEYLHKVGYEPEVMLDVIGVLKDQEVFEREQARREGREPNVYHGVYSTHPRNDDRLQTVVRAARKLSQKQYRNRGVEVYLNYLDGLPWGESARQGVLRGNRFVHPVLRFELTLPQGWQVVNYPDFLQARDPDSAAVIQVGLSEREPGEAPDALLRRISGNGGLVVETEGASASAMLAVRTPDGASQPARVTAIGLGERQMLILTGSAPSADFTRHEPRFRGTERSFRRLSAAEAAAVPLPRLRILTERRPPSFSALARASALTDHAEDRLRLLNRSYPDGDIAARVRLKQVSLDD